MSKRTMLAAISLIALAPSAAEAGLSDWIGGQINQAVSSSSTSLIYGVGAAINNATATAVGTQSTGLSGTPLPMPGGTHTSANDDCTDVNNRIAQRLSANVNEMAPRESPGRFLDEGYGVNSLLRQVIPNGGFSFSSLFQSLTTAFLDHAANTGRNYFSGRLSAIVSSVGGRFPGLNTVAGPSTQQVVATIIGTTTNNAAATMQAAVQAATQSSPQPAVTNNEPANVSPPMAPPQQMIPRRTGIYTQ